MAGTLVMLNPDNDEQAAPHVLVTDLFMVKFGEICSSTGLLPGSTGSLQGIQKSGDEYFASGGRMHVWRGDWRGKPVAFKVFPIYPDQIFREVKKILWKALPIWKRIEHESVVPIYGVETSIFKLALVYEWSQNGNIMEYLESKPSTSRSKLVIILCSCRGPLPHCLLTCQVAVSRQGASIPSLSGNHPRQSERSKQHPLQTDTTLIKLQGQRVDIRVRKCPGLRLRPEPLHLGFGLHS